MASKIPHESQDEKEKPKNSYQFENFLYQGSIGLDYRTFRENVRSFLQQCGEIQGSAVSGKLVWSTTLLAGEGNGRSFPLYTIEETVDNISLNPFCAYCEVTGWGHHFVSQRKYHFIIPAFARWQEQWKDEILALETHIFYGLVHCNGYGHLIRINGLKEESIFLSKTQVMNFWDRLCSYLCTRKISVRDETNLRLLYGFVNGQSWYGRWGYEFSRGSFAVKEEKYKEAIKYLKSLDLDKIYSDFTKKCYGIKISTSVQNCRGATDVEFKSLSDMLRFMMGIGKPINADALAKLLAKKDKTENTKKTEDKIRLMLNQMMIVLNKSQGSDSGKACIGRQKMLDEIKKCDGVGSKSLINSVLESITQFAIGNCVIRRLRISTKDFEFTIEEEVVDEGAGSSSERVAAASARKTSDCNKLPEKRIKLSVSGENKELVQDKSKCMASSSSSKTPTDEEDFGKTDIIDLEETNVFYDDILDLFNLFPVLYKDKEVRDFLDCKNFVKEWNHDDDDEEERNFLDSKNFVKERNDDDDDDDGEQNSNQLTVDCTCGAKYDDGERLTQCPDCKVQQHTRCRGFDDDKAAPQYFMCARCADILRIWKAKNEVGKS